MGKLSKRETKGQKEIFALLEKEVLTEEDVERFYREANEAYIADVTTNSQFFTGVDLALDFALMSVYRGGTILDLCSGAGVLSWAALQRDSYNRDIKKIILLERDHKFAAISKKLLSAVKHPAEIEVITGDMFDEKIWKDITDRHPVINCVFSNPPFGTFSTTDCDRSWLDYKGKEIDMAAIELGIRFSKHPCFILPAGSTTFEASTEKARQFGALHKENK